MGSPRWRSDPIAVPFDKTFAPNRNSPFYAPMLAMQLLWGPDLRIRESGLGKTAIKGLGTRIVIGCPNVNEHSILLEGKDAMLEETRECISFKAGWPVWNVLQNFPIEYVDSTVNETRLLNSHLFAETNDAI